MTVPPLINVIVSESIGTSVVVTEVSQNKTTVVTPEGQSITTNIHTAPSAFAQHAFTATTASNATTASYALVSEVSSGIIQSSSYSTFAEVSISSSWASQSLSSSYAPSIPTFPYIGTAQITGSLEATQNIEANKFTINAGNNLFIITGSVSTGIFGVTENIYPIISTASFSGATIEYMAQRPGGIRLGVVLALWNSGTYRFTDISTTDIGDTSDIIAGFLQVGSNIIFQVHSAGSGSDPWTVQAMFKLFPNLS